MTNNIWYISKYTAPSYAAKVNARGFLILAALTKMGFHCTLITSDSNHQAERPKFKGSVLYEKVEGVEVYWLKTVKYTSARSVARIFSWLDFERRLFTMSKHRLDKPDIIIVSSLSLLTIFNGLFLRFKYRCKLIFEVRDIWPLTLVTAGNLSPRNPFVLLLGWIERLAYKKADHVVGTMPNLSEHIFNVTGLNIKASCVPQGVDERLFFTDSRLNSSYVRKYVPSQKFTICYAGSIGADNSLETFFNCARLMKNRLDVHFLIVGDGYLKDKYKSENNDLTNLTFAPRIKKSQVSDLLANVDIVYFSVSQSLQWSYGQSLNKIIDYMTAGKPIIASYSGYPSMINEANCGLFVPAGDPVSLQYAIERFSEYDKVELERIGSNGRRWVLENRRFEKLAERYIRIFKEISNA